LELPPCTDPCSINDLIVEAYDCTPNGVFFVDLNFNPVNPIFANFDLYIGDELYGNFAYSDLPLIQIGPLEANGEVYVFTVKDAGDPACAASFELESEDCQNVACSIDDLEVISVSGSGGLLIVSVDFNNPAGASGYSLTLNGEQTIQVGPPPFAGTFFCPDANVGEILICSVDDPDCCAVFDIDIPPCDPCTINDLIVEPYPCNAAGEFYVDLDFNPANPIAGSFNVYIGDDFFGNFQYTDLPLFEFGPFEANGEVYVFTIQDEVNPACTASFTLESQDCLNDPCSLENLSAELLGDFGTAGTTWGFDFDYTGSNPEPIFDLYVNGEFYSSWELSSLPVVQDIPCLPNNFAVVKICVQGEPDCCAEIELELP
ncbi:MAG: hypothetical protein AAFU60_17375, partial [Bacteroidota bacterium]